MATLTKAETKKMYSWWWDSHISPKNSKWLQDNLTDMDAKVKLMIKLIEVDEDSFARRAEMYYKKRPELMKLVEEFYRAFRALAERYDHATGVIKQAHKTMAEAFPNQVPFILPDEGSFNCPDDSSPCTPEMSASVLAFCQPGDFNPAERNGAFVSVQKELKFLDADEKKEASPQNGQVLSESERLGKSENDIQELQEGIARLEAKKQAGLLEYQESLKGLHSLESQVSRAQVDSRGLLEQASKAEAEVEGLKVSLADLTREREACLHRYEQCLNRISNLESNASQVEKELVQMKSEREAGLTKYMEAVAKTANLENKLLIAEDKVGVTLERAYNAEMEVATLKECLGKVTKEKEAASLQYQQCVVKIASLESEIVLLERSNISMQGELDSLLNKFGVQNQELRSVDAELQKRVQVLKEMEFQNQRLQDEVQKIGDERTALQKEICCLKECFESSVKNFRAENSKLKDRSQKSEAELSFELEDSKARLKELEESSKFLMNEKSTLSSQLDIMTEDLEKFSERNTFLEDSLIDTEGELEALKKTSKNLEDSCQLLKNDKFILLKEREALELKLETAHQRLEELEKRDCKFVTSVAEMENEILDQAVSSQFEICIYKSVLQDLKETNSSLLNKCDKLLEMSKLSEELILELEHENIEQHEEVKFLSEQIKRLRMGMLQLLNVLDVDLEFAYEDNFEKDQMILDRILSKLADSRDSLCKAWDENQKLVIEKSVLETLLGQLKQEVSDLKAVINTLQQEFRIGSDQLSSLQKDMQKLLQSHEQLILRIDEGNHKEELLVAEVVSLKTKLREMQDLCQDLEKENCGIFDLDALLFILKTNLKESLEKFDSELKEVKAANSQLKLELDQKDVESESLRESMQNAAAEVCRILKRQKETDRRVEILQSELKKVRVEAELWETVAGTFFSELQTSSVREALFREKFSELSREYECLEDESHSKGLEVVMLKERVESLEGENSQMNTQMAGNIQALATLKDSVASLESHAMHTEFEKDNDKDSASSHELNREELVTAATSDDAISSLLKIASRIKAVETKVIKTKKLAEERSLKSLRSLSSKSLSSRSRRTNGRSSRHIPSESMEEQQQQQSSRNRPLMKDIMLDQASEASSRGKKNNNRRGNRYNNTASDDQILELWETMDQEGSIDLTVGRSGPRSSDSMVEKQVDVDKSTSPRKILERLASDVQRLTNLQITVQDLKQKVLVTESSNPTKGKGIEYLRVKEQLDEAERAIAKLVGVNGRLMKNAEENQCSPESCLIGDDDVSSEIGGSGRKRKAMEQARRCAEKIGRLQMEVQMIQLMLVKLDGGNKNGRRGSGARAAERNTRIILKDYLYVSPRTPRRKKKGRFCGCMLPPTIGD